MFDRQGSFLDVVKSALIPYSIANVDDGNVDTRFTPACKRSNAFDSSITMIVPAIKNSKQALSVANNRKPRVIRFEANVNGEKEGG